MMSSTTTPRTEEEEDDDENLEAFFRDIEKLEISETKPSSELAAADDDDDDETLPSTSVSPAKTSLSSNKEKKKKTDTTKAAILQKAEQHQQAWQEFTIEKAATTDRPKISFALDTKKKKKKASKRKETMTIGSRNTTTPLEHDSVMAASHHTSTANNEEPLLSNTTTPRWTVVLDTCALLQQSLEHVCDLLQYAEQPAGALLEPLTLVVPYTLWSELDYQSKKHSEEEDVQHQARCAVRVLNRAIAKQAERTTTTTLLRQRGISSLSPRSQHGTNNNYNKPIRLRHAAIRSQSRAEMNRVAANLGFSDAAANNDDHILACALAEQKQQQQQQQRDFSTQYCEQASGGVVLLTLDKVLSGKARADGVKVYTPWGFLDYYRRRDASLRARRVMR